MNLDRLNIDSQETADVLPTAISEMNNELIPLIPLAVFFMISTLAVGAVMKEITKKLPLPYPAAMFILGIFIGSQYNFIDTYLVKDALTLAQEIDANQIMSILIPPIIFYSSYTADIYILKHHLLQIIMLSLPSLLISTALIAISLKWLFLYSDDYYSWGYAVVFGAIVTCTDPTEVVNLLTEANAPKKFISLVQGESLFNNGIAMIMLLLSVQVARGGYGGSAILTKYGIQLLIGGVLVGLVMGVLTFYWMKRVNSSSTLTVNVTVVSMYLTYFIAENVYLGIDANGLIAVMTLGIYMSAFTRTRVRSESEYSLQVSWEYILFIVQSLIFMLIGLSVGYRLLSTPSPYIREIDYSNLSILYCCVLGARFASIFFLMNLFRSWGVGMRLSEMILFTYSGCRGALQLTFALLVLQEKSFSVQQSQIILFHCAGIVILTMLINGSTTGLVVIILRLARAQSGKQKVLTSFLQEMCDQVSGMITRMQVDLKGEKVDWDKVKYFSGTDELEQRIEKNLKDIEKREQAEAKIKLKQLEKSLEMKFRNHLKNQQDPTNLQLIVSQDVIDDQEDMSQEIIQEARDLFLMALRQTYWDLFSQNQCSGKALSLLVESLRWDIDTVHQRMCSWDFLHNLFYSPIYMRFLYWLKGFPLIGRLAGNMLFDWVGMGYDVISTYVKAHEEMEQLIQDFPIQHNVMQVITKESQENRTNAERFIAGYLQVSFPEIIRLIQNKKATMRILMTEKKFSDQKNEFGELEKQEYQNLQLELNSLIGELEDMHPNWHAKKTFQKLMEFEVFKEFNDVLLKELCRDCIELVFDKDQYITREGELARYVYVVLRGRVVESCQSQNSHYTQVLNIGCLISPHHVMLQSSIFITQNVAEAMVEVLAIPMETIFKLVQQSPYMQQYLWNESLYALSRFYYHEMKPLGQLEDSTLRQLTQLMRFAKFRRGQNVQFQGAILLTGKIESKSGQQIMSPRQDYQDEKDDFNNNSIALIKGEILSGPHLIPPKPEGYIFTALTQVHAFLFDVTHVEDIQQVMVEGLSLDRSPKHKVSSSERQYLSGVNRQTFGFSYLRRPTRYSKQEGERRTMTHVINFQE